VVQPADHLEVLEAGQVLVDGRVLAREADVRAQPRGFADDVEPRDAGRARVGPEQRREDADARRLAGAVRAEKPEDASGLDAQVDVAERLDVAVPLAEPVRLDGGGCGSGHAGRRYM